MASPSYVKTLTGALDAGLRQAFDRIFEYVLANLRLGHCVAGERATNLQLYAVSGRTHATPDTEFALAHGLPSAPYLVLPILSLENVNEELVPLKVTRAPDAKHVYLSSSVADAPFRLLLEF